MRHDKIIGQVQARAQLASRGEAEAATRATLETLGERIPPGAAENLAAQLRGDSWPVARRGRCSADRSEPNLPRYQGR